MNTELSHAQQENFSFFQSHLSDYLKEPLLAGKYAIFFQCEMKEAYDTFPTALSSACAKYPLGQFIIQRIVDPAQEVNFVFSAVV